MDHPAPAPSPNCPSSTSNASGIPDSNTQPEPTPKAGIGGTVRESTERFDLRPLRDRRWDRNIRLLRLMCLTGSGLLVATVTYQELLGPLALRPPPQLVALTTALTLAVVGLLVPAGTAVEMLSSDSQVTIRLSGGQLLKLPRVTLGHRVILVEEQLSRLPETREQLPGRRCFVRVGVRWVPLTQEATVALSGYLERIGYRRGESRLHSRRGGRAWARTTYLQDG